MPVLTFGVIPWCSLSMFTNLLFRGASVILKDAAALPTKLSMCEGLKLAKESSVTSKHDTELNANEILEFSYSTIRQTLSIKVFAY